MTGRRKTLVILGLGVVALCAGVLAAGSTISDVATLPSQTPEHLTSFEKGRYHFSHGDDGRYNLPLARQYFTEALMEEPSSLSRLEQASAWYQLARIDFIEGRFDASIYKCRRLLEDFKDMNVRPEYILGLAYAYKAQTTGAAGDWAEAEAAFLQVLADKPESPWARTDLAWIYFSQGKYSEMVPVLEGGLRTEPESPWLLNMYGLALLNTDRREEAEKVFAYAYARANELTVADWGNAYPGNDARRWEEGLNSFRAVIKQNRALARTNAQD